MTIEKKQSSLPEKVMRRHAEMLDELLPHLNRLVIEEERPVDVLLSKHLRGHKELGSRDRRFLSQAVFSYFRWLGWTEAKLKLSYKEACLVGAALDANTELAESFRYLESRSKLPHRMEPLGSKTLSEKSETLNQWFKDSLKDEPLHPLDLVPPSFDGLVAPGAVLACIESFQHRPPTWLRLRNEPVAFEKLLKEKQLPFARSEPLSQALSMPGGANLNSILSGHTSQFVVQDIASQCVGLICDPQPGGDWWDCCAGAGGKALHLMDLMKQDGKVLATDVRISALKELKKRARKLGIRDIRTQPFNAAYDEPFRKTFDGVLVDAPCSGWGTWSRNPDARLRTNRRDVMQCNTRQQKILSNTAWCVKPGGVLVYAVCSITRPESEEIISLFLDQHPDFQLDPFNNPLTGNPTEGMCQLWPYDGPGDGMFITRMIRCDGE